MYPLSAANWNMPDIIFTVGTARPFTRNPANIWNGDTVQLPSRYLIAIVEELDSQL